jgi:hypothetical protein
MPSSARETVMQCMLGITLGIDWGNSEEGERNGSANCVHPGEHQNSAVAQTRACSLPHSSVDGETHT